MRKHITLYLWGLIPLIAGVSTLAAWMLTRNSNLAFVGLVVLAAGILATMGYAIHIAHRMKRSTAGTGASLKDARFLYPTILMSINYPAAIACIAVYHLLSSTAYVRIHNASGRRIDELLLSGYYHEQDLGSLCDGATRRTLFFPQGDSGLDLRARQGEMEQWHTLSGYLMTTLGDEAYIVVIKPELQITSRKVFED